MTIMLTRISRRLLNAAALLLAPGVGVRAQQAPPEKNYQQVWAGDLIAGYIPAGTQVEASGHIGVTDGVVTFKVSEISAQAPMTIDTTALPPTLLARLT